MSLFIVFDSTANFRPSLFDDYQDLFIVSLNIHIGEEVFREKVDITDEEFYFRMRKEQFFAKTSQPSAGDFLVPFENAKAGDEGLILALSSRLSGTYQSAVMAAAMLKERSIHVEVVDTLNISACNGFMVERACELRQQGCPLADIVEEMLDLRYKTKILFVPKTLEYLARGGRIGRLGKFVGNSMQIKPLVTLIDGLVDSTEKVRTEARAQARLIAEVEEKASQLKHLAVLEIDSMAEAQCFRGKLQPLFPGPIPIYSITPVVGSHVGPDTIGIAYCT
jgi:DegV family protein with EDD domain